MYYGWISAEEDDKRILQSLGILLGHYNYSTKTFQDCEVPSKALNQLDQYWGRIYWGLDRVSGEVAN